MHEIAQYTTPSVSYKPSKVEVENVTLIEMVIKQNGKVKIQKGLTDAQIIEGRFVWYLSQTDTEKLSPKAVTTIKFDIMSGSNRWTTREFGYKTEESAISEVL